MQKKPRRNTIVCRFLQGIWFHTQREDGANTSNYGLPKGTVHTAIMIFYSYTKVKVRSPDGDFFDIVADVL